MRNRIGKAFVLFVFVTATWGSAHSQDNARLRYGTTISLHNLPVWVAKSKGLFARNGLDIEAVGSLNLHEQRFLELARAIAGGPRLLVLDEVMAGLNDAELSASIEIIRTIRDQFNMTIIWVEHVMKAVMSLAERIVVLNFGNVLTEGLPKDVMRHPAVIEAYLGEEIKHA